MILIGRMEQTDAAAVAELENKCFSEPWSEAGLKDSLSRAAYRMLTAKDNGKVVGYIGAYMAADELNITNIAVHPAYRRQGIGAMLLDEMIHAAEENRMTTIYLEVRVSNQAAIALYRKAGFDNAGIRKNFYDNPKEDAKMMCLYLD